MGPYYAMMPRSFAEAQVRRLSSIGDYVLDPFSGRGTVPFAAACFNRKFLGIEIFPVGWLYSKAKCAAAKREDVLTRLKEIAGLKPTEEDSTPFLEMAYCKNALKFLQSARAHLDWKNSQVDATLMSFILVSLHDKKGRGLSNQMRQTKAVDPNYAIRWWRDNGFSIPPEVEPINLLTRKIEWRYRHGIPAVGYGKIELGNCLDLLPTLAKPNSVKLMITSPPYFGVTSYHIDQWLRNWMLGGKPSPTSSPDAFLGRFKNKETYSKLLLDAFTKSASLLSDDCKIVVRTDARQFTLRTTITALHSAFPNKRMYMRSSSVKGTSQTKLFGTTDEPVGEVDIFLR